MSSRALRRIQREQEEKARLERQQEEEEDDVEGDEPEGSVQAPKHNAFSFLNAAEDEEDASDADGEAQPSPATQGTRPKSEDEDHSDVRSQDKGTAKRSAKKKAKKKKKAAQAKSTQGARREEESKDNSNLDEIDAALKSLKTHDRSQATGQQEAYPDQSLREFYELLAVDSRHLNALNEMKKLFGNTVMANESPDASGRRRGRGPQALDLGAALAGRNNPVSRGQGLSGLALRRNVFVPGKEEWPKATSGGLGMELVEKAWDFTVEYRFVHSRLYFDVQKEFLRCVESMDPQNMIVLLQMRPYHVSTLLQVSEIAKQQGDHAVAADLLERALFTFGRSVQSSFGNALAEGKARLDYRRFENREFWLAAWRYISSLGQRGTWRTAFEWAKLLLSLDPEGDPLCLHLILDQLAVRGGEFESLIRLAAVESVEWGQKAPNVHISLALAQYKLKRPTEAREALAKAVQSYPWAIARLFKELNIDHIPKSIWGREPRNSHEALLSEAYAIRAKDMWNVPEALSLLVEVAETAERVDPAPAKGDDEISLNEARHFILSETPALLSFLPRSFTAEAISGIDPLPPADAINESPNEAGAESDEEEYEEEDQVPGGEAGGPSWLGRMWSRFMPGTGGAGPVTTPAAVQAAATAPHTGGPRLLEAVASQLLRGDPGLSAELAALSQRQMEALVAIHSGELPDSNARALETKPTQAASKPKRKRAYPLRNWSTSETCPPASTTRLRTSHPTLRYRQTARSSCQQTLRPNPARRLAKALTMIRPINGGLRAEACCN